MLSYTYSNTVQKEFQYVKPKLLRPHNNINGRLFQTNTTIK